MAQVLVMPKLGLTMEEGILAQWLCEPGQEIALGQQICEVETDKLTVAVESPYAGVLLHRIESGGTVPVGEPIAVIGEPGEDASAYRLYGQGAPAGPPQEPAQQSPAEQLPASPPGLPSAASAGFEARAAVSPLARRLAAELGVDLAAVRGTGPDGRIMKQDIEQAAAALGLDESAVQRERGRQ